jgi:hypothetical protein
MTAAGGGVDILSWIPEGIVLVGFLSIIVWVSRKAHTDDPK